MARVPRPPVPGAGGPADAGRRRARARRHHRRVRPDRRLLPDGPRQPRSRHGARRLPAGARGAARRANGSATRTTATSTSPACWPGGWRSCCAPTPGRRRPSCPTCPTRSASAAPSGATRRRSRRSSRTTRSARAWRAASPSSSGAWPLRRRLGRAGRLHLIPGTQRPARGESGGPSLRPRCR